MKNLRACAARYLVLAAVVGLMSIQASAQPQPPLRFTSNFQVVQKADLPSGGIAVPDPVHKQTLYYYVNTSGQGNDTAYTHRDASLYGSGDDGKTWYLLSGGFEFENLFVHPTSGEMFAVIQYKVFSSREDGTVSWSSRRTALRSVDGKSWKDMMAKQPHQSLSSEISVDPDHPNRIRLIDHEWRAAYLVAVDDEYSSWKRVVMAPPF